MRLGQSAYVLAERKRVFYPKTKRNDAWVTYYSVVASLVELSVDAAGSIELLSHHHIVDCGKQIVPELVSGQIQGGVAMEIGMAMFENLPLYEDGPANGTWNLSQYHLPRASNVAVWNFTSEVLKPLTDKDPSKAVAEIAMIPIIPAISNAVFDATGRRVRDLPITADKIRGHA
jgi:CO/xanthine dehydrogenase Mo-binding subunit